MIGRTLAHFRVLSKIGEGGMGEVYRALDTKLDREVALKIVPAEMASDPDRLERFRREAKAIAALNHPNIVTIHSVEQEGDRPFIAMELVDGESLTELIPHEGMSLGRLLDLSIGIAEAVSAAHERGVTHRDIKPANVMVTTDGRVKVLDFGLAKLREKIAEGEATQLPTQPLTAEGRILGTVNYMAPEQLQGRPADPRSDIFSLGVVLYEMATGRRPFSGESSAELISSILRDIPTTATDLNPGLPRHLGRIIRHCLEKDPERRYQTVKDVRNELTGLRHELTSGDLPAVDSSATSNGSPSRSLDAPARRTGRTGLVIAGLVVAAAIVSAVLWLQRETPPAAAPESGLPTSRTLAVVGFENLSDPEDPEQLGRMLSGLITTDLAETGGLSVVSMSKVLAAIRDVSPAERVGFDAAVATAAAERAGAELMLVGQIGRAGERLLLTAELSDVHAGNTLSSIRKEADSSAALFELAGAIAVEVRERLGIGISDARTSFDLAKALTSNADAYRSFVAGETAMHQNEWTTAVGHFEAAIRADSSFALAYYRLGLSTGWQGKGNAAAAAERGLPYIDRLPERWQVLYRAYLDYERGDVDVPYETLSRLGESADDLADAHYLLGEICTHFGRYQDYSRARRHFERALEIDPTFRIAMVHLVEDYALADDPDAARRQISQQTIQTDRPNVLEIVVLRAEGRYEEAADLGERLLTEESDQIEWGFETLLAAGRWNRVLESAERYGQQHAEDHPRGMAAEAQGKARIGLGRLRAAVEDLRRSAAVFARIESVANHSVEVQAEAIAILLMSGDHDGAVFAAREGLEYAPENGLAHYDLGRSQLFAGRQPEAEATLTRLREFASDAVSPIPGYFAHLLQAELHLASGKTAEAAAELATASAVPIENRRPSIDAPLHGRVAEASGDLHAALAAWERVLEPRGRCDRSIVTETLTHYELGRLNDELGQREAAREHYREFLARWGEADLPIPAIAKAKEHLAKL